MHCRWWFRVSLLLIGVAVYWPAANAEGPSDNTNLPTESDYLGDVPLVRSATRLPQLQRDTPASITIIDRDMIRASGAIELPDLFRLVPGFQVAHVTGNRFAVTYHGLSDAWPRRMQILVDGRSVYLPLISNVDWTNLGVTIQDIERIEVVQGSDAPVYGSNAFLATINIITRQPFLDRGWFGQVTSGSQDTRDALLRYGGAESAFDYRITADYRQDDGFDDVNDRKQVRRALFRGSYSPNSSDSVDAEAGYSTGTVGAGATGAPDDRYRDISVHDAFGSLRWRRAFSSDEDVQVQYSHNYYRTKDQYPIGPLSEFYGVTPDIIQLVLGKPDQTITHGLYEGDIRRDDLNIQHTFSPGPAWRVAWGGGWRSNRMVSRQIYGPNRPKVSQETNHLFLHTEWRATESLVVNVELMAEHDNLIETAVSRRAAINYHLSDEHTLRTAVSVAKRAPSLFEEYTQHSAYFNDGSVAFILWHSDANLKPERLTSYEIGYLGGLRDHHASWDVKLFRDELRDILHSVHDYEYPQPYPAATGNGADTFENEGYATLHGAEGRLSYRPRAGTLVSLQYAYARAEGEKTIRRNPTRIERYDDAVPMHTGSLLAAYTFDSRWSISMAAYHMDNVRWMGDGDSLDGYDRLDIRIAKVFELGQNTESEIALIGQNLNGDYKEFQLENTFERRVYLQASLKL